MDAREIETLGIDGMENFDPTGGILGANIANGKTRGAYASESEATDAQFTLSCINATTKLQTVEMFGAADSIAQIAKDTKYNGSPTVSGIPYRPCTSRQILQLIGKAANIAEAGEGHIVPKPLVIFDDNNGNLVYVDPGTTGTPYMDLSSLSGLFDSNANLAWNTAGVTVIVTCPQRPYKALLEDLKDLCLFVRFVRAKFSNIDGIDFPIHLVRPKSFGGEESNTLEVVTYQSPQNQLNNVVDIRQQFYIDKLTTLYTTLAPKGSASYSTTSFNFWISAFRNNGVEL